MKGEERVALQLKGHHRLVDDSSFANHEMVTCGVVCAYLSSQKDKSPKLTLGMLNLSLRDK